MQQPIATWRQRSTHAPRLGSSNEAARPPSRPAASNSSTWTPASMSAAAAARPAIPPPTTATRGAPEVFICAVCSCMGVCPSLVQSIRMSPRRKQKPLQCDPHLPHSTQPNSPREQRAANLARPAGAAGSRSRSSFRKPASRRGRGNRRGSPLRGRVSSPGRPRSESPSRTTPPPDRGGAAPATNRTRRDPPSADRPVPEPRPRGYREGTFVN